MTQTLASALSLIERSSARPTNSLGHYKGLSDNHVSSFNLWNNKASFLSGKDAGALFGVAASEAKLGLDTNKYINSEITCMENNLFRALDTVGSLSKMGDGFMEIMTAHAANGPGSYYAKVSNQYKQKREQIAEMENFAQQKMSNLHALKSSFQQIMGENETLFKNLEQAAQNSIVLSDKDIDNRNTTMLSRKDETTYNKKIKPFDTFSTQDDSNNKTNNKSVAGNNTSTNTASTKTSFRPINVVA